MSMAIGVNRAISDGATEITAATTSSPIEEPNRRADRHQVEHRRRAGDQAHRQLHDEHHDDDRHRQPDADHEHQREQIA